MKSPARTLVDAVLAGACEVPSLPVLTPSLCSPICRSPSSTLLPLLLCHSEDAAQLRISKAPFGRNVVVDVILTD